MIDFRRTLIFRYTLTILAMFLFAEIAIFGFLYWATVAVYDERENEIIHADLVDLRERFQGVEVAEMIQVINLLCADEPGEDDEYLLTGAAYNYLAGNVRDWPAEVDREAVLIEFVIDHDTGPLENVGHHRVIATTLPSGHRLLVGRNVTELKEMRVLIRKAMVRSMALTALFGLGSGFLVSRAVSRRLDNLNELSFARASGDWERRLPLTGSGDEFDVLAGNVNRTMDHVNALMRGMREVTENIAHDIRKPITRLRSRIEVTLLKHRDAEAYRETLERTIDESDNILAMFNGLLTIALAESGTPRDRFEELDLAKVARDTVEIYEPVAEDAGLDLRLHADEPVTMHGNPHLITQALANLLDNATKYARGSGLVSVSAFEKDGQARLIVADHGPGIPAEFREKAMDRFTRGEASRTTTGSGLGLSLVRAVAHLHAGSVELDDNHPGLRITLTLPIDS